MAVVDKVLVGEALVVTEGGDNEISHIEIGRASCRERV